MGERQDEMRQKKDWDENKDKEREKKEGGGEGSKISERKKRRRRKQVHPSRIPAIFDRIGDAQVLGAH